MMGESEPSASVSNSQSTPFNLHRQDQNHQNHQTERITFQNEFFFCCLFVFLKTSEIEKLAEQNKTLNHRRHHISTKEGQVRHIGEEEGETASPATHHLLAGGHTHERSQEQQATGSTEEELLCYLRGAAQLIHTQNPLLTGALLVCPSDRVTFLPSVLVLSFGAEDRHTEEFFVFCRERRGF